MLNMEKKLKEESKLVDRIEKLEARVATMEGTLKAILDESIHQSKILTKMLAAQTLNPEDTKKGRRMSLQVSLKLKYLKMLLEVPQIQIKNLKLLSNPPKEREWVLKLKGMRRDKGRDSQLKREGEKERGTMILDNQEGEKTLAGTHNEVIDKLKHPVSTKEQRRGRDEATLKLI